MLSDLVHKPVASYLLVCLCGMPCTSVFLCVDIIFYEHLCLFVYMCLCAFDYYLCFVVFPQKSAYLDNLTGVCVRAFCNCFKQKATWLLQVKRLVFCLVSLV